MSKWRERLAARTSTHGGRPNDMAVLGVDPGGEGGAAALLSPDGVHLQWWAAWQKLTRKKDGETYHVFRVRCSASDTPPFAEEECPNLLSAIWLARGNLMRATQELYPWRTVVEQLFIESDRTRAAKRRKGKGGASPKMLMNLAEYTGAARMAFASPVDDEHRFLATVWRHGQLGLPASTDKHTAERIALERAPVVWRNFPDVGDTTFAHLAEACFIARHGCTHLPALEMP